MFRNAISILAGLILASLTAPSAIAADSCGPVFDAITKLVTSASHSYSAGVLYGKPISTETIYVQGKTYLAVNGGKWMLSPATPNDVLQQEKKDEANGKATCQLLRSESVNSEPASVYSLRRETETLKETGQVWISKITGRELRQEVDVDYGGTVGKGHFKARYEYSNVKPPM